MITKDFFLLKECPVCKKSNISLGYEDIFFKNINFTIQKCNFCKISYTNPQIRKNKLKKLYTDEISMLKGGIEISSKILKPLRVLSNKMFFNKIISKGIMIDKKDHILDYGAGEGVLVDAISKTYPNIKGADFIKIRELEENFISFSELDNNKKYKNIFKLIILRHVLEHTHDPENFLKNIEKNYLKIGGYIILEVPNYNSIYRNIFGKFFSLLTVPYHLFHFDSKSIELVIPRNFNILYKGYFNSISLGTCISNIFFKRFEGGVSLFSLLLFPVELCFDLILKLTRIEGKSLLLILQKKK